MLTPQMSNEKNETRHLITPKGQSVVGGLLACSLLMAGCGGGHSPAPADSPAASASPTPATVAVTLSKVRKGRIEAHANAVGTLFPRVQVSVSSKLSAPIQQMELLRNRRVSQGQVIAVQETRDLQSQRDEALAALNEQVVAAQVLQGGAQPLADATAARDLADARANEASARALFERRKGLYQKGGIALRDLDVSRLAYENSLHSLALTRQTVKLRKTAIDPNDRNAAAAKINSARERVQTLNTQISYGTLLAPISGTVTDQLAFQGEFLAAGAKLMTITDLSTIILKTPFPDEVAAQLKVGDPVVVNPSDRKTSIQARVSSIASTGDPTNRSVEVWVYLHGNLRPGGSARVTVTTARVDGATLVDRSAVNFDSTGATTGKVMVVDKDSTAHQRTIHTGILSPTEVEVKSGLKPGDIVVKDGSFALPDGSSVTDAPSASPTP